jgi:HK97 family phage prohead protease/HK97 family phage major capsid protein
MSEAFGDDAPADRTQDQAVAMCMDAWREAHKKKAISGKAEVKRIIALWKKILSKQMDVPEPDPEESKQDFIDRCIDEIGNSFDDEGDAEEACTLAWEDYAEDADEKGGSDLVIKQVVTAADLGDEYIMSDGSEDRLGEMIDPRGWHYDSFLKNPICLFNHDPNFIVGRWHNLRNDDRDMRGRLEMAPEGTSARIDEIRKLRAAGILRAVSVGFKAKKKEPMDERSDPFFGPFRYLKQELVECSLVSVPANPNALAIAKSLNISPATMDVIFAGSGKKDRIIRRGINGGSARTHGQQRRTAMSLAQRITEIQNQIGIKRAALQEVIDKMDDSNVLDTELEKVEELNGDIQKLEKTHLALTDSEKRLAATLENGGSKHLPAVITATGGGSSMHTNGNAVTRNGEILFTSTMGKKELTILDLIVRAGTVAYVAKNWGKDPHEVRRQIYGDDDQTKLVTDLVLRAASAPAMTTVTGWAAELVQQTYAAMMPTLMPQAILTRLAARGLSLQFGRAGKIIIPTRSRTPSLAGSFVGEGQAIPVRQGAFTAQTLTPKKVGIISSWTKEMDEHSIPAIEGVLREAIQADTTVAVDSVLIDANAATLIRPAGLLNGIAAQTPTAGGGMAALVGDLKLLIGALTTSTYGNVRSPVWLMNPTDVLGASLVNTANTGVFPFKEEVGRGTLLNIPIIDSGTIPAKTMILIDAADFVVADGGAPRFEISDQATLHFEDTNPADLVSGSPGVVATPQKSLFQTDSIALKMVMPLNWVQRRAGTIAWTQNVTWS